MVVKCMGRELGTALYVGDDVIRLKRHFTYSSIIRTGILGLVYDSSGQIFSTCGHL